MARNLVIFTSPGYTEVERDKAPMILNAPLDTSPTQPTAAHSIRRDMILIARLRLSGALDPRPEARPHTPYEASGDAT